MEMPYGFGRGFGFRGSSPAWPYIGRGRGGLPRCWYFGAPATIPYEPAPVPYPGYGGIWSAPYHNWPESYGYTADSPQMNREEELNFLREEANTIKAQLDEIEARIKSLQGE